MTKAPHRPAVTPDDGGALPLKRSRLIPRASNGQFAKHSPISPDIAADPPPPEPTSTAPSEPPEEAATPAQLVARVTRAIERELAQIEDIVGGVRVSASKRTEAEKRARTLASLARTLAEVTRLRSAANEAKPDHDNDAVPRDLDEFRRTLERRLAEIADRKQIGVDRGDEPA